MPDQPQEDDPEPLEISMEDLELSERQKDMLLPTEARIKMLVYLKSIQARVESQRQMRKTTKKQVGGQAPRPLPVDSEFK